MADLQQQLLLKINGESQGAKESVLELVEEMKHGFGELQSATSGFELSLKGVAEIAAVVATAVAAIGGAVVALGVKGADVNDVTAGFQRLAGGTEHAEEILSNMRAGIVNTIGDMELMTDANHLLAVGAVASAEDFGTLTTAAHVLSDQGFGSMQNMIQGVSMAMETGRTRRLALMGVTVDAKGAEAEFAATLGKTAAELSASEKLTADRTAIMEALERTVKKADDTSADFGDRIKSIGVFVENFTDELAGAIAKSPELMRAVDAIGNALMQAFGGDKEHVIETVVGWVNTFANAVTEYGPPVISTLGEIKDAIMSMVSTVKDVWDFIPNWVKGIGKTAVEATGMVYLLVAALNALTGSGILSGVVSLGGAMKVAFDSAKILGFSGSISYLLTPLSGAILRVGTLVAGMGTLGEAAVLTATSLATIAIPLATITALAIAGYQAWKLWQESSERAASDARQASVDHENLARINKTLGTSFTNLDDAVKAARENSSKLRGDQKLTLEQTRELAVASDIAHDKVTDLAKAQGIILAEASKVAGKEITNLGEAMVIVAAHANDGAEKVGKQEKAIRALLETLSGSGTKTDVITGAFDRLTESQKADMDVQAQLIPMVDKLVASHQKVPQALKDWYAKALDTRDALVDQQAATLLLNKGTQSLINTMKSHGESEQEIATRLGVTVQALKATNDMLELRTSIEKTAATQSQATYKAWESAVRTAADNVAKAVIEGDRQITEAEKKKSDFLAQQVLTSTDYQVRKIWEAVEEQKRAFKGTALERERFNVEVEALASAQVDALYVDNQAILKNSQLTLQQEADKAETTYEAMLANADEFSAGTIEKFRQIAKAAQDAADGTTHSWVKAFTSIAEQIPNILQQAFTGGGGALGAAKAGGVMVGTELGKGLVSNLTEKAPEFMGSAIGKMLGSAIPMVGALAGPLIGAIVGLFGNQSAKDVARDAGTTFGTAFSQGTSDAIVKDSKAGMGPFAAELNNLNLIVKDMGGVTASNVGMLTGKFHDLFSMIQIGSMTTAQVTKQLDLGFADLAKNSTDAAGIASKQLEELMHLDASFGTNSAAIATYKQQQVAAAGAGISAAIGVAATALATYTTLSQKQTALTDEEMQQMKEAGRLYEATSIKSQNAAQAIAGAVVGSINAELQAGKSLFQAIADNQDAVTGLEAELTATGFSGGAAFDFIKEEAALATDKIAGPAIKAIDGYAQGLVGLANAGIMNQDMFSGLTEQIGGTEKALLDQGYSEAAVMAATQKDLQAVWELEQQYGYKADDTTQALIDQGVQSGLVGEKQRSTAQQTVDALNKVVDKLDELLKGLGIDMPSALNTLVGTAQGAFGKITDAVNSVPRTIDVAVNGQLNMPNLSRIGAQTDDIPSFAGRQMEQVTGAGFAMLHPGDVVGVPPPGMLSYGGGSGSANDMELSRITDSIDAMHDTMSVMPALFALKVRDALQMAGS